MTPVSLAIVIPTSNRAELAISACRSLLAQSGCRFHVFVSDNSTEPSERQRLEQYCAAMDKALLTYLRPSEPLPMAAHWDWALRRAMEHGAATHFSVHYDRRITKPDHLRFLYEVVQTFPGDMVTTLVDAVVNLSGRSRLGQSSWDGRIYVVPTSHILDMTAEGKVTELGQAFPWLSNCAVPRAVLQEIVDRFGTICDSTTPDSCFAYRFCATHGRYLHYDRPLGVLYGYHRSIGIGYLRGEGGDFAQFMRGWGDRPWLDAAPIPGLNLGQNILFHEYEVVRRLTQDPALKPVEMHGYLRELSRALTWIDDPGRAAEVKALLSNHGWTPGSIPVPAAGRRASRVRDGLPWLRTLVGDVWDQAGSRLFDNGGTPHPAETTPGPLTNAAIAVALVCRKARARTERFLADHLKIAPRHVSDIAFPTDREAIQYALRWGRARSDTNALDWMATVATDVTPATVRERDRI